MLVRYVIFPLFIILLVLGAIEFYSSVQGDRIPPAVKIAEGLSHAAAIKAHVAEYYAAKDRFPDTNSDIGLPPPESLGTQFLHSLEVVSGGRIRLTYRMSGNQEITLTLVPDVQAYANSLRWSCVTDAKDISILSAIPASCAQATDQGQGDIISALTQNNPQLLKTLITHGADVNAEIQGDTPLIKAINQNHPDMVLVLLESGANPNQVSGRHQGVTPLIRTIQLRRKQLTTLLLKHKADINLADSQGKTPLLLAIEKRDTDVMELLLAHDANPFLTDNRGRDAADYVKRYGSNHAYVRLIDEAQRRYSAIQQQRISGVSELMNAARLGDRQAAEQLLQAAVDINQTDSQQATALHYALRARQTAMVDYLLLHGADPRHADRDGNTPLLEAVNSGSIMAVNALLAKSVPVNVSNRYHHSPLLLAVRFGHADITAALLQAGARETADYVLYESLISTSSTGQAEIQAMLITTDFTLANNGVELTRLLDLAVQNNRLPVVRYLLDKGANPNQLNDRQQSPLLMAVANHNPDMVQVLVENGANVNLKNHQGKTALMQAVENRDQNLVNYLLTSGADKQLRNNDGVTALMMARAKLFDDIVSLLRRSP